MGAYNNGGLLPWGLLTVEAYNQGGLISVGAYNQGGL